MGLKAHRRYMGYVLRHKWFVFRECYHLGIPWAGVVHDWSKFLPSEWFPYVRFFYGPPTGQPGADSEAFDFAWLLHQKRNPHHWQFWCLIEDEPKTKMKLLAMPDRYRREMVADWRGAGLAQGKPDTAAWYQMNRQNIRLHPETRGWVEAQLG